MNCLELAYSFGKESETQEERDLVEIRILVEKMFVYFDTSKFDEVDNYLKLIEKKDVSILDAETKSFYSSVLAIWKMRNNDTQGAEEMLTKTLDVLKKESPKHLPSIYIKLLEVARVNKDKKKAEDAYQQGLYYAKKYNMMIYENYLHYCISRFYGENGDFEQAYNYQSKGLEITSKYDANNYRGKLTVLDKDLLEKRKTKEIEFEKRVKFLFILLFIFTIGLAITLHRLYISNKQRKKLIEIENKRMRSELEKIASNTINKKEEVKIENYNFSERQIDIINLVKSGKTNKEIGANLFISENTVKYHLKNIYTILGIDSRGDL